jgi:uncharacterized membrane protein
MDRDNPRAIASVDGHPLHAMLAPFPTACFVGTFLTDVAYAATANMQWANFSAWLLAAGLLVSVFVALFGLVDVLGEPRILRLRAAWLHGVGNAVVLALAILDSFVHSRDAYTSVVPWGLTLSTLVVLLLPVANWFGRSMVYRHGVGLKPEDWA